MLRAYYIKLVNILSIIAPPSIFMRYPNAWIKLHYYVT
nr:MAG TPA: hypothetical protein [Caudoviricetes sp.]